MPPEGFSGTVNLKTCEGGWGEGVAPYATPLIHDHAYISYRLQTGFHTVVDWHKKLVCAGALRILKPLAELHGKHIRLHFPVYVVCDPGSCIFLSRNEGPVQNLDRILGGQPSEEK